MPNYPHKLPASLQPVFLDTPCFIYLLENNLDYASVLIKIFDEISLGKIKAATSIITLTEVLVKPLKTGSDHLVRQYLEFIDQLPNCTLTKPEYVEAIEAAKIRAKYNYELADSYQLALAQKVGCKSFLTNDKKLLKFKPLKILVLEKYV